MCTHVGVYVKCNFEKVKSTRKTFGCLEHGVYRDLSYTYRHWKFCPMCGNITQEVKEEIESFPNLSAVLGDNLVHRTAGSGNYVVGRNDGTNCNYGSDEEVVSFTVIANSLLKFNELYAEEIIKLSKIGPIEVHYGFLLLNED